MAEPVAYTSAVKGPLPEYTPIQKQEVVVYNLERQVERVKADAETINDTLHRLAARLTQERDKLYKMIDAEQG